MRLRLPGSRREEIPGRGIAVVGMHRSGTSCLAGTLQAAGVQLGEVWQASPHNPKGNRESPRVVALNDSVLAASGGSLYDPPARVRWSRAQRRERDALLRALGASAAVWGFRDPRTLLVVDGWLEGFPALEFVGSFRDPARVAASLHRRDGLEVAQAVAIWEAYNERLLALHDRAGFPLLDFDLDADAYLAAVAATLERLRLPPVEDALSFFESELRQAEPPPDADVAASARELHAELLRRAAP